MDDLLLDTNFDIAFADGDFTIGEATRQHQQLLLLFEKGELREFPTRGVGLQSWLNDDVSFGNLNSAIKREFEKDGMKVLGVKNVNGEIQVEATYG